MLMTSPPAPRNQRLSAIVEKRGAWMTTTVPPSRPRPPPPRPAPPPAAPPAPPPPPLHGPRRVRGVRPQRRAVGLGYTHVRDDRPVVERIPARVGTVHVLIADHEVTRPDLGLQAAHRAGAEDPRAPQRLQRPDVGPVVDPVRRETVVLAVPREERDAAPGDLPQGDHGARGTVRRLHAVLFCAIDQGIEPAATDHTDLSLGHCSPRRRDSTGDARNDAWGSSALRGTRPLPRRRLPIRGQNPLEKREVGLGPPAAHRTGRQLIAVEGLADQRDRPPPPTGRTRRLTQIPVEFDDTAAACRLMQSVYVLGDDRAQPVGLERDEGVVSRIGLRPVQLREQGPVEGVEDFGAAAARGEAGYLERIYSCPQPAVRPEVGQSRLGTHPGSRKRRTPAAAEEMVRGGAQRIHRTSRPGRAMSRRL